MSNRKTKVERLEAARRELQSSRDCLVVELEAMRLRAEKAEARCEKLECDAQSHRKTVNDVMDAKRDATNELERVRKHREHAVRTLKALCSTFQAAVEQMDCDPDDVPF